MNTFLVVEHLICFDIEDAQPDTVTFHDSLDDAKTYVANIESKYGGDIVCSIYQAEQLL